METSEPLEDIRVQAITEAQRGVPDFILLHQYLPPVEFCGYMNEALAGSLVLWCLWIPLYQQTFRIACLGHLLPLAELVSPLCSYFQGFHLLNLKYWL